MIRSRVLRAPLAATTCLLRRALPPVASMNLPPFIAPSAPFPWLEVFDPFPSPSNFDFPQSPRIDVRDHDDRAEVEVEVPRFSQKNVKVTTDAKEGVVRISGERKEKNSSASFERSFTVSPQYYKLDAVKTAVSDGILTITLPKIEQKVEAEKAKEVTPTSKTGESAVSATNDDTDVAAFDSLSAMAWPPMIDIDETSSGVDISTTLPPSVKSENVGIHLEGRSLHLSVNCNVEKSDKNKDTQHSYSRTLNYSTTVPLPRGTKTEDISADLEKGALRVHINKRNLNTKREAVPVNTRGGDW